jgi:hypothetical protein
MTAPEGSPELEYLRRTDLVVEVLDDETLVWDGSEQAFHRLDATTTAVWNACADWATAAGIVAALTGAPTPVPAGGADDIADAVNALAARRLVRVRPVARGGTASSATPSSDAAGA